ncbi:unnamed protein product [Brassicogethes aeneus]|uniref:Uncharacterized protein n=1 Tax=Brassicogethes aeneus TaxID=1431903 RepID=A0A9P0ASK3_BRAAE|nr:unnamed protein product [Brassicogethes aeneus]
MSKVEGWKVVGGSSGIGSDHPPSPDSPDAPDNRFSTLDNQSTSDEDWNGDPADSTLYLMHGPAQMTLPRPKNAQQEVRGKSPDPTQQRFSRYEDEKFRKSTKEIRDSGYSFGSQDNINNNTTNSNITKYLEKPIAKFTNNNYLERQKSLEKEKVERQKSLDTEDRYYNDAYYQEKEKYNNRYDRERFAERYTDENKKYHKEELRRTDKDKPIKYFEDDGFDENIRYRSKSTDFDRQHQRFSYDEEEFFDDSRRFKEPPVAKTRQKYAGDESNSKYYKENSRYYQETTKPTGKFMPEDPRYYEPEKPRRKPSPEKYSSRSERDEKISRSKEYFEEVSIRRAAQYRQRSPSPPEECKAPRDRFKDAKEKFLLMERVPEPPSPPHNSKEKNVVRRQESMAYATRERYDDSYYDEHPKASPRKITEEVRYRRDISGERYRNTDKFDPKRRSMFSLLEEEHKKNSNEIAKELKRRSYLETSSYHDGFDYPRGPRDSRDPRHFQDEDRYKSIELEKVEKYNQKFDNKNQKVKNRHSYAEPKLRVEKNGKKHFSEMLHRTNSSVSNNNRVGIPY